MFGCKELRRLREEVAAFAAGFDAGLVDATEALVMLNEAATMEKISATIMAMAAARIDDTNLWAAEGDKHAAAVLAKKSGTSVGRAKDAIRTAKRLADQPELDSAARKGEVSVDQAAAISDAAAADPTAESRLIDAAGRSTLSELRDECERTRLAADRDAEARHRRIHGARFARKRHCADGSAEVVYRSTRDDIATFWAVASGYANAEFKAARAKERFEPPGAYAADGLLAMAKAAARPSTSSAGEPTAETGSDTDMGSDGAASLPLPGAGTLPEPRAGQKSPVPTRIVVRIDWEALIRGFVAGEETCEIAGLGQVPVSVVRAMIDTGDPFLAAVVTKGVDVVNVAHLGRRPSAHQQTALEWLSPTCPVLHCDQSFRLEYDHEQDWADTHITLLSLLNHPCGYHHDLKTYKGWALVEGSGKRPMVPPDDPRHPRYNQNGGPR